MEYITCDFLDKLNEAEEQLKNETKNICEDCIGITDSISLEHNGAPCCLKNKICEPGGYSCFGKEAHEEIFRLLEILTAATNAAEWKAEKKKEAAA